MQFLTKYGKVVAAAIAAVLIALQAAVLDGHVDPAEILTIAIAGVTALSVWLAPNLPSWPGVKTGFAVVLTALNAAAMLIVDGWSTSDTISVILAAAGVIGVISAPAQSAGDDLAPRAVAAAMRPPRTYS